MNFLFTPLSHFNLANLFTFVNITAGLAATYYITQNNFFSPLSLLGLAVLLTFLMGRLLEDTNSPTSLVFSLTVLRTF